MEKLSYTVEEAAAELGYVAGRSVAMSIDRELLKCHGIELTVAEHEAKYGHDFPPTLDAWKDKKWREAIDKF